MGHSHHLADDDWWKIFSKITHLIEPQLLFICLILVLSAAH